MSNSSSSNIYAIPIVSPQCHYHRLSVPSPSPKRDGEKNREHYSAAAQLSRPRHPVCEWEIHAMGENCMSSLFAIRCEAANNVEKGVTTFSWYKILIQLKKHRIFIWTAVWCMTESCAANKKKHKIQLVVVCIHFVCCGFCSYEVAFKRRNQTLK